MKVLIVTNALYPLSNANSDIAYKVADILHDKFDVEIEFLGCQMTETMNITPYRGYRTWYLRQIYRYIQAIPAELPKWKKCFRLLLHPKLWPTRYRLSWSRYPMAKPYRCALLRILKEEPDIDAVISVVCPFDSLYAAAEIVKDRVLIGYKLDPWGMNQTCLSDKQYWEDEQKADAHCDAILVTPPIYQDYQAGRNLAPLEKIQQVEFPNLLQPARTIQLPVFDKDNIHCAYVGQLYDNIRKPDYLFDLFRRLEKQPVVLHIIGNTKLQAKQYQRILPKNVILHGRVPQREAIAYMQAADILVNLGNTVSNQLPSKLISYISYGKPILNLCKIPNCPTLPYMEKYPLSLTVMEEDGILPETVDHVAAFCTENKGKQLSFETVKTLFYECTPEYVGGIIYKTLLETLEKRKCNQSHFSKNLNAGDRCNG